MLELTKEQIQQLVDTIESKQDCHCSVSNSMRTIWITSSDGENELRVAFLGNFALVLSRVELCCTKTSLRSLAGALLVFSKTLNLISLNSDSALFGVAQLGPTARYHGGRTQ